jgi:hypothetical protein
LHIGPSTLAAGFTADVEKYRSALLVVGRVEVVLLLEGSLDMRFVTIAVREMVNLAVVY